MHHVRSLVAKEITMKSPITSLIVLGLLGIGCGAEGLSAVSDEKTGSGTNTAEAAASNGSGKNGGAGSGTSSSSKKGPEVCGDGLDNDMSGAVDESCSCTEGTTQRCFLGDPAHAGNGPCLWGTQTCEKQAGGGEFGGKPGWGPCTGSGKPSAEICNGEDDDCNGIVDDKCTAADTRDVACDALPRTLGGYKVDFDAATSSWVFAKGQGGHPVRADGSVDDKRTCTMRVEQHAAGSSKDVVVPAAAKEIFFQVVGGGGGGGRSYNPPSSGGGAGAFVTGTINISAATAPITLSMQAGNGGDVTAGKCSEPACNFECTCQRGPGSAGSASLLKVGGETITAGAGAAGTAGVNTSGGKFEVTGTKSPGAVINVNPVRSKAGNDGIAGGAPGNSGPGGSTACNWGFGANDNQSGAGFGGGGGGGNNSPAGAGSGGVVIVYWPECTP